MLSESNLAVISTFSQNMQHTAHAARAVNQSSNVISY
jgi:hypothetical protein